MSSGFDIFCGDQGHKCRSDCLVIMNLSVSLLCVSHGSTNCCLVSLPWVHTSLRGRARHTPSLRVNAGERLFTPPFASLPARGGRLGLLAALLVSSRVPTNMLRNIAVGLRGNPAGFPQPKYASHMIGRCKGQVMFRCRFPSSNSPLPGVEVLLDLVAPLLQQVFETRDQLRVLVDPLFSGWSARGAS